HDARRPEPPRRPPPRRPATPQAATTQGASTLAAATRPAPNAETSDTSAPAPAPAVSVRGKVSTREPEDTARATPDNPLPVRVYPKPASGLEVTGEYL